MSTTNLNRIDKMFEVLRAKHETAMISFITAGDPDLGTTADLVLAMEKAGADIIELGIPYSDPLADGVVIQESSARALKNGATITKIMETVKKIRHQSSIPLVYLVYYNSVFKYGIEKFLEESNAAGIDGLIIPDLPIEERSEMLEKANEYNIALIPLVAPTSKERIKGILDSGKGFVYCVSTTGVTGVRSKIGTNVENYMKLVGSFTSLPRALGFGISGPEMAKEYKPYCDGIIVGSAIVKKIAEAKNIEDAVKSVYEFVKEIKDAIS